MKPPVCHAVVVALVAVLAACADMGGPQEDQSSACPTIGKFVGSEATRDIFNNRVAVGMTRCEVVAAWGIPQSIDVSGYDMNYVYRDPEGGSSKFVRFTNGRVRSIF